MNKRSTFAGQYAEISPDARFEDRRTTLTYAIPERLRERVLPGQLVWVPLRRQLVLGLVMSRHDDPPDDVQLRDIHAIVTPEFVLSDIQWQLAVWISENTLSTLFEAASPMFPPGVSSRAVEHLRLADEAEIPENLTQLQGRLVALLHERGEVPLSSARSALNSSLSTVIPALEELGLIERVVRVRERPSRASKSVRYVHLPDKLVEPPERAHRQREVYDWIVQRLRMRSDRRVRYEEVLRRGNATSGLLNALAERGSIIIEEGELPPIPAQQRRTAPVRLTEEQERVWRSIAVELEQRPSRRVLLQGVTGSGKTEVYFRLIADVLASRRSAILLVPEIGLAGQIIRRARARFGQQVILHHSDLPDRERQEAWSRAAADEPVLVVGPRSALFAPVRNLGCIIVDEEHESSYKQDQPPRYHATTVAERLAELHGALLLLGSATPDVVTRYRSQHGTGWTHEVLDERIGGRVVDQFGEVRPRPIPLPAVEIIDMRATLRESGSPLFSPTLCELIQQRLDRREQTILFLNRRGLATIVQCRSCGAARECPYCDIPLVYHRPIQRILCHRCGHSERPPTRCSECGKDTIGYFGAGTQRVEQEITNLFPMARVLRWDRDALRGSDHEALLARVEDHEVDIVVGTQMVAKGLDLPGVTLVGIVNADTYLHLPDFRSAERTFQMLSQVSGRAGRRAVGGQVVVQTYSPDHYAIVAAARHDYDAFFREEIAFRRQHGYPPFKRLVRLLYRHTSNDEARDEAFRLVETIERHLIDNPRFAGVDILGPAPAFIAKLRGRYGWQILLRGDLGPAALADLAIPFGWSVDVDPTTIL